MAHLDIAPNAPQAGAANVPSDEALHALLRRAASRVRELQALLPADLSDTQRVLVANGVSAITAGVVQTTAAMGFVRRGDRAESAVPPEPAHFVGFNQPVDGE